MKSFANLAIAVALSAAGTIAVPATAIAQDAAAPAGVTLNTGTTVYDSAGAVIGTVSSNDGTNSVINMGDQQIALPNASFGAGEKGPAIGVTLEQLTAGIAQQKATAQAAVTAALVPGASVKSLNGTAEVGTVKSADADGVILTTTEGDVRLPSNSFFIAAHGLSSSFTAEQFAAAIAQAKPEAGAEVSAEVAQPAK
jgi:hypothetical protein